MADADNLPTKEQVEAANKAEEAKWQGDFDEESLSIPYKREKDAAAKDDDKPAGAKDDDADNSGAGNQELDDDYEAPTSAITIQDPGQYQPADYSFEVTLKDGKTVKVSTPDEADKVADDPDNFATPKQLSDFLRKQMSMERKLERDKESYDKQKKDYDEQSQAQQARQDTVNDMAAEFDYLTGKGLLPEVDPKYLDADWNDPEVAKQDGVKEQIALINYMVKENEARAKAKVKPLTSIVDVYNSWKLENKESEAIAEAKAAGEVRKAASSRVAAASPAPQGSYVPKGIAVGRTGVFDRGAANWED